jgi:hypothetical protein
VALSGDATISNAGALTIAANAVGTSEITNGVIIDEDINAAAGISISKLETGTAAYIIVNNTGGVPTSVAMSGDASISNTGVVDLADALSDNFTLSGANTHSGANTFSGAVTYTKPQFYTPSDITVSAGSTGFSVNTYSKIIKMSCTAGASTIIDISDGADGQEIILHNSSASTFSVTIDDDTEFQLNGSTDRVLGPGDSIHLWYDNDVDIWYEIGGNN